MEQHRTPAPTTSTRALPAATETYRLKVDVAERRKQKANEVVLWALLERKHTIGFTRKKACTEA
eukprot:2188677-Rhodomonas_salina.1